MEAGTLGGIYTTVEGLITQIIEGMSNGDPVFLGDSAVSEKRKQYDEFMKKLQEIKDGKRSFTLDIIDPLANSWIYSDYAPEPDPRLESVDYTRSWEENEALGINDMVVEDEEILRREEEEKKKKMEEAAVKVKEEEETRIDRVKEETKKLMEEVAVQTQEMEKEKLEHKEEEQKELEKAVLKE